MVAPVQPGNAFPPADRADRAAAPGSGHGPGPGPEEATAGAAGFLQALLGQVAALAEAPAAVADAGPDAGEDAPPAIDVMAAAPDPAMLPVAPPPDAALALPEAPAWVPPLAPVAAPVAEPAAAAAAAEGFPPGPAVPAGAPGAPTAASRILAPPAAMPGAAPETPVAAPDPEPAAAVPAGESPPAAHPAAHALHRLAEAARAEPARAAVAVPVSHPAFPDAAAERVSWLAVRGIERARIALTPPELGPVEARIAIDRGEATIQLVAASPEARAALEASLPRLAERLAESGILLADASVSRDGRPGRDPAWPTPGDRSATPGREAPLDPAVAVARARAGLVDDFA